MKILSSLKKMLIINSIIIAVLPILILGFITYRMVGTSLKNEIENRNYLLAGSLAGQVEGFLDEALNALMHAGDDLTEKRIIQDSEIDTHLESVVRRYTYFEMIQILDNSGRIRNIAPYNPDYFGIDMSIQDYFQNLKDTEKPCFSASFISTQTGHPTITLSLRMQEMIIVGFLNLSELNNITDKVRIGETGYAAITDSQGTIIAHRERTLVSERLNVKNLELIEQTLVGKEGTFHYQLGDEKKIGSTILVPETGWVVFVSQTAAEAFSVTAEILKLLAVVILITSIFAFSLAFEIQRKILNPISHLVLATGDIADGKYLFSPDEKSYLEVDRLSNAFSAMSSALHFREQALKRSEEKYRELVQNANSIIIRWDREGKFTFFNEYAQSFFGYTEEEAIGRSLKDLIIPETETGGRDLKKMIDEMLVQPRNFGSNENENIKKNGERVWVQWSNKPILDEHGKLIEILSIGTDITEKRILEKQLHQSQKMEAVGRLAGGIAHDFNNLLTAINGYCELILSDLKKSSPIYEDVEEIKRTGERAASLTAQLLAFSRRQVLQPKELDLNILVKNMEVLLRRIIGEDIEMRFIFSRDLKKITADPHGIEMVIMNLAVNAHDAMPEGGKLTVETSNTKISEDYAHQNLREEVQPGSYVMLSVSDTGIGMDQETLAKIFEPFFTTKELNKGTGLGLSTVYGIIKQSNGSISVQSEPGKGTTFCLYLPPS